MQSKLKKLMQNLNIDNIVAIIFVLILVSFVGVKLLTNKDNKIEKNEISKNKLAMYVNE